MEIVNIEKLYRHNIIVMTGRDKHVRKIATHLQALLYYCPRQQDYFKDYPVVVDELQKCMVHKDRIVIITTQSAEFLDCLLESNIDFVLATVRKFDRDDNNTYRLRVLPKEEALELRRDYSMELRV